MDIDDARAARQSSAALEHEWFALPDGEPMGIEDIRDALVIREDGIFLLTDPKGNVPGGNREGYGVYAGDTRHLSAYDFSLNGARPVVLLSTARQGYAMEQVMTNPRLVHVDGRTIHRGSVELRRQRVIDGILQETLEITNYNPYPVTLHLLYEFGADFADIFDVRGYEREQMGKAQEPRVGERSVEYAYIGVDASARRTRLDFDRRPDYLDATTAMFRVALPSRGSRSIEMRVTIGDGPPGELKSLEERFNAVETRTREWLSECASITTGHPGVNRALSQSLRDVRMLWSRTESSSGYPAAGTPWFDALFGRDACIASMQLLPYRPQVARDCLRLLAKHQGTSADPTRDEEPGKILHELRVDELSRSGELPYGPYFGSIDSTPLFLMLLAEYHDWTADDELARDLLPNIEAALSWMEHYGDPQGIGHLSYEKRSARGLVNQGWKDSWDAIMHTDGGLVAPPIALVEVQGYAYAAYRGVARVYERLGDSAGSKALRSRAEALKRRFNQDFWMPDEGYYALAVDGKRQHARSVASNAAHCLWTGIIDEEHAPQVVNRLVSREMFSGWGIRTLSASAARFNPIGYHTGSVWPHDNSIAGAGMKRYGFTTELNRLTDALFQAASSFPDLRLPELFGGQERVRHHPPVPYPVACRPQAWAAGALPFIMASILGLKANATEKRMTIVAAELPAWLGDVVIRGVRVGSETVDLRYEGRRDHTNVEVVGGTGGIDVVMATRWPDD